MMRTPIISVIVPIYNVAPYLRECLDSILHQSYPHLQVIMVDDGSLDESLQIAKEYLSDSRFELVCKENGGLSSARNAGMKKIRGEYVAFIDSDDYIALCYFEEMLSVALDHRVELVCNENIVRFYKNTSFPRKQIQKQIQPEVFIPKGENICFGGAVWRFLFSTDFLKRTQIQFMEGKIYEDEAFLYMIAPLCSSFVRFSGEAYFYRQRKNSIMNRHKNFRSYDLLDIFEAIYRFYEKHQLLDTFVPPYYFLCSCGIGYKNEEEYLSRAKALAEKLNLQSHQHSLVMQNFLEKDVDSFAVWLRVSYAKDVVRTCIQRSLSFAKRKFSK